MSGIGQDVRYALRGLRKSPGFTSVAVLTLAFGSAATISIFSLVDSALLKPLTYQDADRLYVIHEVNRGSVEMPLIPVNATHFEEWQRSVEAFEQMALVGNTSLNLTGSGEPERLPAGRVSPHLFAMLGAHLQLGRAFTSDEDQPGRDRVVVLNPELWRLRFNADRAIIGRRITLNGEPYEVIGVLGDDFRFPKLSQLYQMNIRSAERPVIWRPFVPTPQELVPFGAFNFVAIGKLRPGATPARATAELDSVQARWVEQAPQGFDVRATVVPLQQQMTQGARRGLQMLLAAVGMVLLIGCINVANLLLTRASRRRQEIGIRTALGATRGRLMQQALLESLILSGAATLIGLAIAGLAVQLLVASAPVELPRADEVQLDWRAVLFASGLALISGLLIGALPVWRLAQTDSLPAMRSSSRTATIGKAGNRLRSTLVAVEVAVTVICLIAAGLLLHSFVKLLNVEPGFEIDRIVSVEVNLPVSRYPDLAARAAFARESLEDLTTLRGVTSAAVSSLVPLTGEVSNTTLAVEGTTAPQGTRPNAGLQFVSVDLFRTLGIPLKAGRLFHEGDRGRRVAVVSAFTAERLWPAQNAIGRRFRRGPDTSPPFEVIGIVGDIKRLNLQDPPSLHVYEPYWQALPPRLSFVIRASSEPSAVIVMAREVLRKRDPELPIPTFRTMAGVLDESVATRRFQMNLVAGLGVTAMLLALFGIYAMVSYTVTQRTSEIGIRMSLGAVPSAICRMVIQQSLTSVFCGLLAGVICSLLIGRGLEALLFGVTPYDVVSYGAVTALVLGCALLASGVPARRAARVDPLVALRYE